VAADVAAPLPTGGAVTGATGTSGSGWLTGAPQFAQNLLSLCTGDPQFSQKLAMSITSLYNLYGLSIILSHKLRTAEPE
jgi:hypothetical protein